MKFVIDMNFPDSIPASYIKEIVDGSILKNVKDPRDCGYDGYDIMTTTLYPCGNEIFLNVDFTEAFNRSNVGDSVVSVLNEALLNPVIRCYNMRDFTGWEVAIDKSIYNRYHKEYMDLVKLYHVIDDWFLRSKQNEFCEKFCKPDDAPGHPTTITLWHEEVSGSGCTCYVTAYVELHIDDDNQVTITKMDQIQKSSKTFTLDEAYNYIKYLPVDNIMKHFLVEEAHNDVDVSIHYSGKTADRIRKVIAKSDNPNMTIEEFVKNIIANYIYYAYDDNCDKQTSIKDVKTVNTNSCDHKCNCDCNKKVSHESKENSGIDWNAVAGNIFGNVFGNALKLLTEMNNDKKEKDKND